MNRSLSLFLKTLLLPSTALVFGWGCLPVLADAASLSLCASDLEATSIQLSDRTFQEFFSAVAVSKPLRLSSPSPANSWRIQDSFQADTALEDEQNRQLRPASSDLDLEDQDVLEDLYSLKAEFSQETTTKLLESKTQVELQLSKNPLGLSNTDSPSSAVNSPLLPQSPTAISQPFSTADLSSQKNALVLSIQQEITVGEKFNVFVFSELYPAIADPTVVPEWPTVGSQNQTVFNVEMEISYQLTDTLSVYSYLNREDEEIFDLEAGLSYQLTEVFSLYGSVTRSLYFDEESDESDLEDLDLSPVIDNTLRAGISSSWRDGNLEAAFSLYQTFAQPATLTADLGVTEPSEQTRQYLRRGVELSLVGQLLPHWTVEAIYTYTTTQQPDVAPHSAELYTTYEIQQGALQGLGVTSSLVWESSFLKREDTFGLQPAYLRTDAGVFYRGGRVRAYLGLENLFAFDQEPWAIVATVMIEF
ncbi:MAG: TonB-dependent receptor [Aphanocapsa sp. GSE-SYN-MK-11-07L]|jgi:iron complex outermembrane receptor protein|nr:TonB-dependent receptor [Aphanocapsa sp. GSE-SYN-MK-11-07L]